MAGSIVVPQTRRLICHSKELRKVARLKSDRGRPWQAVGSSSRAPARKLPSAPRRRGDAPVSWKVDVWRHAGTPPPLEGAFARSASAGSRWCPRAPPRAAWPLAYLRTP